MKRDVYKRQIFGIADLKDRNFLQLSSGEQRLVLLDVYKRQGLGCAEEQDCVADIDFLCGTFGKALASVGGYIVCSKTIRDYLINKMRTFIFTTALPPVNLLWTFFILEHLDSFSFRRDVYQRQ